MNGKITYHQQVSYCGKPRCRRCREGTGHGPYWYAYQTVDGRTTRTYVGKQLPPEAQATVEGVRSFPEPSISTSSELEQIRIYTLGQFRLERRNGSEWQTVTDSAWQHQRVRALLGCLVSGAARKLAREPLMDAIWPELDIETAGNRLDRAVHSLRQVFEPSRNKLATSQLLLTEREVLALANQQQIWIDADAFEQLIAQAHARDDVSEKERLFEEAVILYGGDFLPEERKVELTLTRRESLLRSWTGLLIELADLRIAREALTGAIHPLDRLLSIDPTNEAAVQRLIRVLAQLGRRGEALRAYKRLATVLQQEYKIVPLPETRSLYEAVRSSATAPTTGTDVSRPRPGSNTPSNTSPTSTNEPTSIQIGRTHQSPLVGRSQELDVLHNLLAKTEHAAKFKLAGQKKLASSLALDTQRTPQCVLLMGEVGIGKTRLAEEVGREARKRGWLVAWSRVYAQEGGIPYRLWIEVLRKALTNGMLQRQEISKRPLVYQPLNALLPELHNLLPQVEVPASMPPEQEQLRLWEAARELLTNVAEGTPLLIVLDDLQWSDGSSCELLAYLARRIYGHPIIIVGTCRENELPANHPLRPMLTDLQREHAVETVSLEPLSNEQIATLVTQIAQPMLQLPEPVVERIQNRAAGNPFFAEELTRGVQNQSDISPLPDSITAVLDLRLSRLSMACQRLLSKAAVLGGSFEFSLIQQMEASTPGSDEDAVLDRIEEALESGMLTEEGVGTRITYLFWHPLLVSHLYEGLSAARRASLHRRTADILQQTYQRREEEGAAIITHHLVLGGAAPQQIIHYAELAGDKAYALSAYPDTEKFYRIAVEQIDSIRQPMSPDEQMHLAYLLERLGECTIIQGKTEEARHFYERVLEVRSQQRTFAQFIDSQQEAQIQALLWCEIGLTWYGTGDNMQAQQCYARGEKVLHDAGVVAGSAWAKIRLQQSYISWQEGNYDDARHMAQEALGLFQGVVTSQMYIVENKTYSTRTMRTFVGDPVDLGRIHRLLAAIMATTGRLTEALSHLKTALAIFEQHSRDRDIAHACCNLGDIYLRKAEHGLAQSELRRSLNVAEIVGDVPLMSVVFGNLGVLATRFGDLSEAENWFKQGIVLAERINDPVYTSVLHTYLSTVLQEQGKLSDARASICCSLSVSRSMRLTSCIGLALVALSYMYISQAMAVDSDEKHANSDGERTRLLRRAKTILQRALALEGIEAETKTEGHLLLAQVASLSGDVELAEQRAMQTRKEAHLYELIWLVARTQQVIGSILATTNEYEQSDQHFEQALQIFRKSSMRLDYARTLRERSIALLQRNGLVEKEYQRAIEDLEKARKVFMDCNAELDMQIVGRVLKEYERVGTK